ncbi:MAG: hypothetical protein AAFO93_15030 [Pseudomonadota bacterium]
MFKSIAAAALSATIALTSLTPNTAQAADAEDVAKVLFGALVLYGIADALEDNRKSTPKVTTTRKHNPVTRPHRPGPPKHARAARYTLPASCLLTHRQWGNKSRTVMGNSCLKSNFRHYNKLPQNCFRRFDTVRGTRVGWGRVCLKKAGYTW